MSSVMMVLMETETSRNFSVLKVYIVCTGWHYKILNEIRCTVKQWKKK